MVGSLGAIMKSESILQHHNEHLSVSRWVRADTQRILIQKSTFFGFIARAGRP